jgi:hypothetical protein
MLSEKQLEWIRQQQIWEADSDSGDNPPEGAVPCPSAAARRMELRKVIGDPCKGVSTNLADFVAGDKKEVPCLNDAARRKEFLEAAKESGNVMPIVPDEEMKRLVSTPGYPFDPNSSVSLRSVSKEWGPEPVKQDSFVTKDSGQREEFATGARRDVQTGKPRYGLIPTGPLRRLAELYARGAEKYGEHNWQKGMPLSRVYESLYRHLIQWRDGDRDEDHLAAVAWNAFTLMAYEWMIAKGQLPATLDDLFGGTHESR